MNTSPLQFLVMDDNSDSRLLLVKTLVRKFAGAIVCHRTTETPGIKLLHEIRALRPHPPLVMVSGIDRREQALAAGADRFCFTMNGCALARSLRR